jgi:hypothetical protein
MDNGCSLSAGERVRVRGSGTDIRVAPQKFFQHAKLTN